MKTALKVIVLFIFVYVFVLSICNANPSIGGVSESVTNKREIVIMGNGFGEHLDYSEDLDDIINSAWHDFENGGYDGKGITLMANTYDENFALITDSMNRPGSHYYLRKHYVVSRLGIYAFTENGYYDIWYWTFWFYMPENNQSGKITRLYGRSDISENTDFYASTGGPNYMLRAYCEWSKGGPTQWSSPDSFTSNQWYRLEFVIDVKNEIISAYINGKKQWERGDWIPNSFEGDGGTWAVANMIDGPNQDNYNPNGSYNFDDVYFDHTIARVEISNSQQWSDDVQSHREIQIPQEWSDTQIKVQFNQGSFQEGDRVYLFVVDSDGNVSEGYPITIGQSYGQAEDVNQDGSVNVSDVQLVVNVILGNATNSRADVNGSGATDVSDVQLEVNAIVD